MSDSSPTISKTLRPSLPAPYSSLNFLGKGGSGQVYAVQNETTGEQHACKIIEKKYFHTQRSKHKLLNEIKVHQSLKHGKIIDFVSYSEDRDYIYIILELCINGSLNSLLKRRLRLSELEAQCYLLQILDGIKYLHEHKVIHRDIKLSNVLLNEKLEIKIGDFGLAAKIEYDGERKRTICGTPNYIAPEVLENEGHSYEADIWSFGVMMYSMLIGKPPFHSDATQETYNKIKEGVYSFPDTINLTAPARDLITKLLVKRPDRRIKVHEIFEHDFFNRNKIPKMLPLSTLTVPLSESYQQAFSRKSLSPREYVKQKEQAGSIFRYSSTIITGKKLEFKEENNNCLQPDNEQVSEIKVTANGFKYCCDLKKVKISSRFCGGKFGPDFWIESWVDYSHKHGLAYKLSNGCTGFFFEDSSNLVSNLECSLFRFIENENPMNEAVFDISCPPSGLSKKLQLVLYFSKFFKSQREDKNMLSASSVYIVNWMVTEDAFYFKLSNKVAQFFFRDKTEILFVLSSKVIFFLNKTKEVKKTALSNIAESDDKSLIKRMKIVKDFLTKDKKQTQA